MKNPNLDVFEALPIFLPIFYLNVRKNIESVRLLMASTGVDSEIMLAARLQKSDMHVCSACTHLTQQCIHVDPQEILAILLVETDPQPAITLTGLCGDDMDDFPEGELLHVEELLHVVTVWRWLPAIVCDESVVDLAVEL